MKILVIQKKKIGDVLMSTVIFEALKKQFPTSELHYLVYPQSLAVVNNNPFVDSIVVLDDKTKRNLFRFFVFIFKLRRQKYYAVVDAYSTPNSVIIGFLSGAKVKIGFVKKYSKFLYTKTIVRHLTAFSKATKAIEHRLALIEPLGVPFGNFIPKIFLTDVEKAKAQQTLINAGLDLSVPIVMISAVGSEDWKTYPLPMMARVLDCIADDRDVQLLFNYSPHQKDLILTLYSLCCQTTKSKINIDFYENDLRKFIAITSCCKALIGNEGGATNMAKAIDVPSFSIYNPNVKKQDWSIYENDTNRVSVHIDDYIQDNEKEKFEELFENQNITEIYNLFTLELFKDKLNHFLDNNL